MSVQPYARGGVRTWAIVAAALVILVAGFGFIIERANPPEYRGVIGRNLLQMALAQATRCPGPSQRSWLMRLQLRPLLGARYPSFCAAFADCNVQHIPKITSEDRLRAAITRNGQEEVEPLPP